MRVKCLHPELTEEQRLLFNVPPLFHSTHQISKGKEYVVLGISFVVSSPVHGNTALLQIADDAGGCRFIPSALFEIVDSRCSSFLEARFYDDGAVTMWPSEFYEPYFHDDLSNHVPEACKVFESVLTKMKAEF